MPREKQRANRKSKSKDPVAKVAWLARDRYTGASYELFSGEPVWNSELKAWELQKDEGHVRVCMVGEREAQKMFGVTLKPGQKQRIKFQPYSSAISEGVSQ